MTNRLFAILVGCLTLLGLGLALHISGGQASAQTIEPVTITYQEVQYRPDSRIPGLAFTTVLGVRSDGSFSRARYHEPTLGQAPYFTLQITDVPSAKHTMVDPYTASISTLDYRGSRIESARIHPASSCPGVPGESLLGYPTTVEEKTVSFPTHTLATKKWRSSKLNCLVLREEAQLKGKSGRISLKVVTATYATIGEPAEWMFQVPAGYTERSPNQILAEAARKRGVSGPPWDPRLDDSYYDSRASQDAKPKR
jgi:hypothetical protein